MDFYVNYIMTHGSTNIKFMKILPAGPKLFHADGRADTTKLRAAFLNFVNSPKN